MSCSMGHLILLSKKVKSNAPDFEGRIQLCESNATYVSAIVQSSQQILSVRVPKSDGLIRPTGQHIASFFYC